MGLAFVLALGFGFGLGLGFGAGFGLDLGLALALGLGLAFGPGFDLGWGLGLGLGFGLGGDFAGGPDFGGPDFGGGAFGLGGVVFVNDTLADFFGDVAIGTAPPFVVFTTLVRVVSCVALGRSVLGFGDSAVIIVSNDDGFPINVVSWPTGSVDITVGGVVIFSEIFVTVVGALAKTKVTSELTWVALPAIIVGAKTEDTVVTGPPSSLLVIDAMRPCCVETVVQVDAG